jgi:hypothetical protein
MSSFASVVPAVAPADPTKHVNYTLGMLVGAADFDAEFAYQSGRDKWIVRDLIGHGVVSGLELAIEDSGAEGPRIVVGPGVAVAPSGQVICIAPRQCASLRDWVAAHVEDIERHHADTSPPDSPPHSPPWDPAFSIDLAIVACYRDCAVDPVPIPGEPCRSEDDLTAPSRLQDSFALELRLDHPAAPEADEGARFVRWLSRVPAVPAGGMLLGEFLDAVRLAELSPPASPGDPFGSPPGAGVAIPRVHRGEYLRAALALWATELRPRDRVRLEGADCGCGTSFAPTSPEADCVLIGQVTLYLLWDVLESALGLDAAVRPTVSTSGRTTLLPLWLLREWVLDDEVAPAGATLLRARVLADGTVVEDSPSVPVTTLPGGLFHVGMPGFDPELHAVEARVVGVLAKSVVHTVEFIADDDPDLPPLPGDGFVLRLLRSGNGPLTAGFEVEVRAR